jgi:Ca2+-dependent lipid-binding protein
MDAKDKRSGSVRLFVTLNRKPQDNKIDPKAIEAVKLENGGIVKVQKIICGDLKNVEMMGKNDPFVILKFGESPLIQKTSTKQDAGSAASWDDLDFDIEATKVELIDKLLNIEVYDENSLMSNTLIGSRQVSLTELLLKVGQGNQILSYELFDKNKLKSGVVKIHLSLIEKPKPLPPIDTAKLLKVDIDQVCIKIRKIVCKDLTNVETMFLDKNDPFVLLKFGTNSLVKKTPTKNNAGSEASWDGLEFEITTDKFSLINEDLKIEVYDQNVVNSNCLIGKALISLKDLILKLDKEQELPKIDIFDAKNKKSGNVKIFVTLVPLPDNEISLNKKGLNSLSPNDTGIVSIRKIQCKDLTNVEVLMFDKNDPFAKLQFAKDPLVFKTKAAQNAGSQATWDDLKYSFNVTRDLLEKDKLHIEIYDENVVMAHAFIGDVFLSLSRLISNLDEELVIDSPIYDKKSKKSGSVTLYATLKKSGTIELSADEQLPPPDVLVSDTKLGSAASAGDIKSELLHEIILLQSYMTIFCNFIFYLGASKRKE